MPTTANANARYGLIGHAIFLAARLAHIIAVFLSSQLAQLLAGAAILGMDAPPPFNPSAIELGDTGLAVIGYIRIAEMTAYPLIALLISAFHRRPWASVVYLLATFAAFAVFGFIQVERGHAFATSEVGALLIAPFAGFLVFRITSGFRS